MGNIDQIKNLIIIIFDLLVNLLFPFDIASDDIDLIEN